MSISTDHIIAQDIKNALRGDKPVVALESTVITHGLPHPENFQLALDLEKIVKDEKVTPATIAIIDGKIKVGMLQEEIKNLAEAKDSLKINRRSIAYAVANGRTGGTTVAGTLFLANQCGIKVFATGGIGGVHRGSLFDISSDLQELSHTPMIVVCSGAKSILDLEATLEYLETMGVPVVGYQTDELPGFFAKETGLPVDFRVETPMDVVALARKQWALGLNSTILVVVPPPGKFAIPRNIADKYISIALKDAKENYVTGSALTPFLLRRINELSGGKSLKVNLELLKNNAHIAARIASSMHSVFKQNTI